MMLKFDKPRGQRLMKRFRGGVMVRKEYAGEGYVVRKGQWIKYADCDPVVGEEYDCWHQCNSVRSFRKHLKKNPHMRGKLILISTFIGYDVKG